MERFLSRLSSTGETGGASRDRTDDPLLAKQVLSQLSYGPKARSLSLPLSPHGRAKALRGKILHGEQGDVRALQQLTSSLLTPFRAKLVGLGGFEPPTSPLSGVRSNQLSYRPEVGNPGWLGARQTN